MTFYTLSNVNMDSLKFYLKKFKFIQACTYNNFFIDLVDKNSIAKKSDIVFLHLEFDELNEDIDEILENIKQFLNDFKGIFIISNFISLNDINTYSYQNLEKEIIFNKKLLDFSKQFLNVLILDFKRLVSIKGAENFYDERFWYAGRIKYTSIGFKTISNEIINLINAYEGKSKKVLVLDLDNTLWGGIIGEDEIDLSNEGKGKLYVDFQKNIKKLKDIGVLLAINSKNNYEDAIKGLNHPMSILKEDDFIVIKANWFHKADNLIEIAKTLNLGLDSIVFIDDNKIERESIKKLLPEVIVPDFPEDIYKLNNWFKEIVYKYFAKTTLTNEDKTKIAQYKAKFQREELSKKMSYDEFLKSLEIKLNFYIDDKRFINRYAQMTQKTNQFNLTTKRYNVNDIERFIDEKNYKVIAVEYEDKFLKEGIIGLAILKISKNIEIDTFLLSCRVLKRNVENTLIKKIEEIAKNLNKNIIGYYYHTKKNMQVKDLYLKFGFKQIDENNFTKEI